MLSCIRILNLITIDLDRVDISPVVNKVLLILLVINKEFGFVGAQLYLVFLAEDRSKMKKEVETVEVSSA